MEVPTFAHEGFKEVNENMTKGKAITLATFTAWPFVVPVIGLLFEATGMTRVQPPNRRQPLWCCTRYSA